MNPNYCTIWITRLGTGRAQQKVIQLILQSRCADPCNSTTVEETEEIDDTLTDELNDEFRQYINRPKNCDESIHDIHEYWKSRRDFIIMKQAGMRLAAFHTSSANIQRIFSVLSRKCIPARNSSSIDSLTNLLSIMLLNPINPEEAIVHGENIPDDSGELSDEALILDEQIPRDVRELGDEYRLLEKSDDSGLFLTKVRPTNQTTDIFNREGDRLLKVERVISISHLTRA